MDRIQAPDSSRIERLEQMVLCYEKDLLRICCVYLRDWKAAEDAVQDTFLKAYRHLDTFLNDSNEKTWLIQIAINQCRDMRRSAWYRYIDSRIDLEKLPLSSPPPNDDHLSLTAAIMKLKPKYMEVVLLYFYEGLRMNEIAQLLHISEAAVSIRLKKAKQKLKTELEGGNTDEK